MDHQNPYRSPLSSSRPDAFQPPVIAEGVDEVNDWPWRWGNYLILPNSAGLPPFCVRCGKPTDRPPQPRTLRWINPLFFIMLVISPPLFVLIALIGQRKGAIFAALCEEHEIRQRKFSRAFWTLLAASAMQFLLGVYLIVALDRQWPVVMLLSSFFTLIAAAVVNNIGARVLSVERIEKRVVWLKKLPAPFFTGVRSLPSANGRTPIIPEFD